MTDEEYAFSEKDKVITNLLIPFFQNMTVDTSAEDYISIISQCILKLDVFKNQAFETLGLQFPYTPEFIYRYPPFSQLNNKMTNETAMVAVLNAAFSYFNVGGEFISTAAVASPVVLQISQILNNDFFIDFYDKLKTDKLNKLQKEDFEYLNGLIFYYIIKFLADCIFIQLTIPPATPLIINANSSAPGILIRDDILKQAALSELQIEIDNFYDGIV